MENFPLEEPTHARKPKGAGVKAITRIVVCLLFLFSCYGAGKLAIGMASKDLSTKEITLEGPTSQERLSLRGTLDEPLFMGADREALRAFFNNYATLESRAKAPLDGTGIRKIQESIEVQTMRSEADAIQVRVSSGAVAGAVYWVHHTQVKEDPAFDPIISPIPSLHGTSGPKIEVPGAVISNE